MDACLARKYGKQADMWSVGGEPEIAALQCKAQVCCIVFNLYDMCALVSCWYVAVVSYVVLSGAPAFPGDTLDEKVARGEYTPMTGKRWAGKSENAKSFVKELLVVSTVTRLTAEQALAHPWISCSAWLLPPPDQPGRARKRVSGLEVGSDGDGGQKLAEAKVAKLDCGSNATSADGADEC